MIRKLLFAANPTFGCFLKHADCRDTRCSRFHAFRRVCFIHSADRNHRNFHRTATPRAKARVLAAVRTSASTVCRRPAQRKYSSRRLCPRRAPLRRCGRKRRPENPAAHCPPGTSASLPRREAKFPPRCTPAAPAASATSSRSFTISAWCPYPLPISTECLASSCSNACRAQVLFANLHKIARQPPRHCESFRVNRRCSLLKGSCGRSRRRRAGRSCFESLEEVHASYDSKNSAAAWNRVRTAAKRPIDNSTFMNAEPGYGATQKGIFHEKSKHRILIEEIVGFPDFRPGHQNQHQSELEPNQEDHNAQKAMSHRVTIMGDSCRARNHGE